MKNNKRRDPFNLDYSRIRQDVEHNVQQNMPAVQPTARPRTRRKVLFFAVAYAMLFCAISLLGVVGVYIAYAKQGGPAPSEPQKEIVYVSVVDGEKIRVVEKDGEFAPNVKTLGKVEQFDRFVAFCNGSVGSTIEAEHFLRSYCISEADKDYLQHYISHYKAVCGTPLICSLGLGEIGGEDYIAVYFDGMVAGCEQCATTRTLFKSNLGYTLADVVDRFEQLIGEKLPDAFLTSVDGDALYDPYFRTGIYVYFKSGFSLRDEPLMDKYQKAVKTIYLDGANGSQYQTTYTEYSALEECYYAVYKGRMYVVTRNIVFTGQYFEKNS